MSKYLLREGRRHKKDGDLEGGKLGGGLFIPHPIHPNLSTYPLFSQVSEGRRKKKDGEF